jgi:predicted protein tyrosine phosphatase
MSLLLIAPFSALEDTVKRHRPSHLLTLLVEPFVPTPQTIHPDRHLRLCVHDIVEPADGSVAPETSHVADLIAFGKTWDRTAPLLVHCWAGISRSTAAAYILLCDLHGPGQEERIANGLRFHAPHAQPNRLLIRHADLLLGRGGRMIAAVDMMGEARAVLEGEVVELPLTLDEL